MSYQKALTESNARIKTARQQRKLLISLKPQIEALDALFPGGYYYWIGLKMQNIKNIYRQPGFTSESNPSLLETLEQIETILSPLGPVEISSHDVPEAYERQFRLNTEPLSVLLCTVLDIEDSACQRQITGYEEIEESREVSVQVARPIYKFVC